MSKSRICRMGSLAAFGAMVLGVASSDVSTQSQAPARRRRGSACWRANLAKPRPKAPFDLTGTWLHNSPNGEPFDPPEGFKLTPEAQVHTTRD